MATPAQQERAFERLKDAFADFIEIRKNLTIWEFEVMVRMHLQTLGGEGFVASMGEAISAAATRKE